MKRYLLIVLSSWMFVVAGLAHANDAPRDPAKYFFNETWGDFHEEVKKAKAEGKDGIMLFFEQAECPFCHYMKTNVLNQPEVQEYYRKHFLLFTVDIEGDVDITDLKGKTMKQKDFAFKEQRVRATPVIAFFDLEGNRIHRYIGKTNGVEEFMWLGHYIADGSYKKMPFIRYKQAQRQKN
ncbi:MAG: thioredoxin fold domain-containing protein [Gammaproteobacteria bacterium]|nr:thioredoxin fold domain-containing protein [Gammaproteobacteria bacterium]